MPQQNIADQDGGDQGIRVADHTRRSSLAAWHMSPDESGGFDYLDQLFIPEEVQIPTLGAGDAAMEAALGIGGAPGAPAYLSDIFKNTVPTTPPASNFVIPMPDGAVTLLPMDRDYTPSIKIDSPVALAVVAAMPRRCVAGCADATRPLSPREMRFLVLHVEEQLAADAIMEEIETLAGEDMEPQKITGHKARFDPDAVIANLETQGFIARNPPLPGRKDERTLQTLMDASAEVLADWDQYLYRSAPDCSYVLTPKGVALGQGVWGYDGGSELRYGLSNKTAVIRPEQWPGDACVQDAAMATADAMLLAMADNGELERGALGAIVVDMAREALDQYRMVPKGVVDGDRAASIALCRMAEASWTLENAAIGILEEPWGEDPGASTSVTAPNLRSFLDTVAGLRDAMVERGYGPHWFDVDFRMSLTNIAAVARGFGIVSVMERVFNAGQDLTEVGTWIGILKATDRDWLVNANAENEPAHQFGSPHEIELKAGHVISKWVEETVDESAETLEAFAAAVRG